MGLFSKSVTTVGTSVMRAIEDEQLPDSIRTGFVNSTWNDDGQIIENIMDSLVGGIGMKASRMYEYAKQKYTYGLPTAHLQSSRDASLQVVAAVEALEGGPITVNYYHFGAPNMMHIAWYSLFKNMGYNTTTNEIASLTATKGGNKVYLKDMFAVVRDATVPEMESGAMDQWTRTPNWGPTPERPMSSGAITFLSAHNVFKVDTSAVFDYVKILYVWEETVSVVNSGVTVQRKVLHEDNLLLQVSGFNPNKDWHQMEYTHNGVIKYFMYASGAGTYPAIDAVHNTTHNALGQFFPFTYFRFNKTPENAVKTTPGYKTSKKLVGYLNMDFDDVCDSINSNPDIADVEQAMLMMAVPADTSNPMEQRYLYDFFKALHTSSAASPNNPSGLNADDLMKQEIQKLLKQPMSEGNVIIQDNRFKMAMSYTSISKQTKEGNLGPVGSYSGGYATTSVEIVGSDIHTGSPVTWASTDPCHFYRRQITETTYEVISVYNLKMTFHIFNEFSVVADENDKILIIPIDTAITDNYSVGDREQLYSRGLHYVINSRVVTKLKWYQTPAFRAFLLIVAIVLTIIDLGADGGSWIAGALAVTGYTAIVVTIIFNIIMGKLLAAVLKLFVKVFGIKIAFIVAIIAIMYGAYNVFEFGSVVGAPWAMEMLQLANGLISAAMEDKFHDLLLQQEAFKLYADEQTELIESANKLLETTSFLTPAIIFGEKPQDFYERTIHSGNIGVLSMDALSSYVDIALTLPKITQTLGDS
jgi:hypothetical protein